LYSLPN
jgi:uncharacterized protein (DUF2164 family)